MFRRALRLGLGPGLPYRGLRTRKGGFTLGKAEGSSGSGEPKPSIDVTFKVRPPASCGRDSELAGGRGRLAY
jgi:hypothetical protein